MPQYENNGNSASDVYEAKQLDGGDSMDGAKELDASWRNKTISMNSELSGDVQARELAENDVAREARRKIMAILEEDEPPQHNPNATDRVRRKNAQLTMDDLMDAYR